MVAGDIVLFSDHIDEFGYIFLFKEFFGCLFLL